MVDQSRLRVGLLALLVFLIVMAMTSMNTSLRATSYFRRQTDPPTIAWQHIPDRFELGFVADLDKASKVSDSKKPLFKSYFQKAVLTRVDRKGSSDLFDYSIVFHDIATFNTTLNEAGRGFELSELAWFQGNLHSFDDRTGIIFRLENFGLHDGSDKMRAVPVSIAMEGDGTTPKGQKHEWATVKDGELFMGSIGKEFTSGEQVIHENNMWVSILARNGAIRHEDWTDRFKKVREAVGCGYPGYVIHEAIEWSPVHRKWFILPRRVSREPYDDMKDEKRGSNTMILANEDFTDFEVRTVGTITPERGFSSFKFVPGTQDSVIVALKSMENEELQTQAAYVTVFTVDGVVLMPETALPGAFKFFAHFLKSFG
ncbi:Soluble calcium-activated nucleotidase 1 [Aphanomyces cochlioides]|nr:Soluble calcium-activated nucleotidase 1 [Aphanomyces cochlioides]